MRPVHEGVEAAQCGYSCGRWAQHQMVGVAQHDVRAEATYGFGQHSLYRGGCTDGHEGRGFYDASGCVERAEPCRVVGGLQGEVGVFHGIRDSGFWGICKEGLGCSDWVRSFYDIINLLLTFTPVTIFAITGSNKEVSLAK